MKIKRKVKKNIDSALKKKIKQTWKESLSIKRPCILCDELTMGRGIFVPENPQAFGASEGQIGGIVYPFCSLCYSLPHEKISPLIEQILFSMMKKRMAGMN